MADLDRKLFIEFIKKAIEERLSFRQRKIIPPEIEVLGNEYIYYKHSLLSRGHGRKTDDYKNTAFKLHFILRHLLFFSIRKIFAEMSPITYVMVISIRDGELGVVCASCGIYMAKIDSGLPTGVCVGTPECISKVIEKERLKLVILPKKIEIPLCKEYGIIKKYIWLLRRTVHYHYCITAYYDYSFV